MVLFSFSSPVACQCDPRGSLSLVCNRSTGVCPCRRGVGGDRCSTCVTNSTGSFPNCEECDECADQWLGRITPLRTQILMTASEISNLNLTNQVQGIDIPSLQELLQLAQEIRDILDNSTVDMLASDVQSTHSLVCGLVNRTQDLLQRAKMLERRLEASENTSSNILSGLAVIRDTLSNLVLELANISTFFDSIDVSNNSTLLLEATILSLVGADGAQELVRVNFTFVLSQIQLVIQDFVLLNASLVEERNDILLVRVDDIQRRIDVLRAVIDEASVKLCGGGSVNATCGGCGGLGCDTCGATVGCEGLTPQAMEALNTSQRALDVANTLLGRAQAQLNEIQNLLRRAQDVGTKSLSVEEAALETRRGAEELLLNIQSLISALEAELDVTRVDPEEIGMNVNATLGLQLNVFPEEVCKLVM